MQTQQKLQKSNLSNQQVTARKPAKFPDHASPFDHVLSLHSTFGNQAVQKLIESGSLQTKLTVGPPNDIYEQEADRVAEQVMRMPEPESTDDFSIAPISQITPIQRMCPSCEDEIHRQESEEEEIQRQEFEGPLQRVCAECEEEIHRKDDEEEIQGEPLEKDAAENLQLKSIDEADIARQEVNEDEESLRLQPMEEEASEELQRQPIEDDIPSEMIHRKETSLNTPEVTPSLESSIRSRRGGGQPLPSASRDFFGPRIGADFSSVRVHNDSSSDHLNRSLNARAFTTGQDIFFRRGEYNPSSSWGKKLLAHELTHVVQQGDVRNDHLEPEGIDENPEIFPGEGTESGTTNFSGPNNELAQECFSTQQTIYHRNFVSQEETPSPPLEIESSPGGRLTHSAQTTNDFSANVPSNEIIQENEPTLDSQVIAESIPKNQIEEPGESKGKARENVEKIEEKIKIVKGDESDEETAEKIPEPSAEESISNQSQSSGVPPDSIPGSEEVSDSASSPAGETLSVTSRSDAQAALTAQGPPPPSPGPTGASQSVANWQANVQSGTQGIEEPNLQDVEESPSQFREQADQLSTQRRNEQPDLNAEAGEAIPSPPETEEPIPAPEPNPVPESTRILERAGQRRLPNQSLPAPVRSPEVVDTEFNVRIPGLMPGEPIPPPLPSEETELSDSSRSSVQENETDPRMSEAVDETQVDRETEERRGAASEPITLIDEGPPTGEGAVPPELEADLTDVLATLLAGVGETATGFVDGAERQSFPGGALERAAPEIADAAGPILEQELRTELDGIREAAGIESEALSSKVLELSQSVEETGGMCVGELEDASQDSRTETEKRTTDEQTAISGAAETNRDDIAARQEAATGQVDEAHVERKANTLISNLHDDAAQIRASQRLAKENRDRELGSSARELVSRYTTTASQQGRRIRAAFAAAPIPQEESLESSEENYRQQAVLRAATPTTNWARTNSNTANRTVTELKRQLNRIFREMNLSLNSDEDRAVELVRQWKEQRLGQERSWWDRLLDLFRDWGERAERSNSRWEETRNRGSRDQAVADFQVLGEIRNAIATGNQASLVEAQGALDSAQQVMVQTFFQTGGNAVAAVAAGMLTRIGERRIPELVQQFQSDAENLNDYQKLETLGAAQAGGQFNASSLAQQIRSSVAGCGTNEERLFGALNGKTRIQIKAIRLAYQHITRGRSMEDDIRGDLSDAELNRAEMMLEGDVAGAEVAELRAAVEGAGTDEAAIWRILRNKTPEERAEMARRYQEMYGVDIAQDLGDDLSDHDAERATALLAGNVAEADAIAIDQAMEGWGTDEEGINTIYTNIRSEVEAEAQRTGMTSAEMEAEIRRRNQEISQAYGGRHSTGPEALEQAFGEELSGAELELAQAYQSGDETAIDASIIRVEQTAAFDTDDDRIIRVLRNQRERAERDARLDITAQFEVERQTSNWTPEEEAQRRSQLQSRIASEADRRAEGNMDALEDLYDDRYSRWGPGALQVAVAFSMGGEDQDMARDLIAQHGRLRPEQELNYAINGLGTNEEAIRRVLRDPNNPNRLRSKDEIDEIRRRYRELTDGGNLDEDLQGDLDGRDAFDIGDMMEGEPTSAEERLRRLRRREEFERGGAPDPSDLLLAAACPAYGLYQVSQGAGIGQYFAGAEGDILDITMADAELALSEYQRLQEDPNIRDDDPRLQEALARFERRVGSAHTAIEEHRAAVDSVTDTMATVAGVAAGIAVAVATAGTATPLVVAAAASAAGTAATVGVKATMLGHAYGAESLATDLAVGGVDMAAAVATAGIGNALLRSSALGQLAQRGIVGRVGAQLVSEGIEGALGAIPSGMAEVMLDDNTWRSDDPLGIIARAAGQAGATGFLMSAGMSGGGMALNAARGRPIVDPIPGLDIPVGESPRGVVGDVSSRPDVPSTSSEPTFRPEALGETDLTSRAVNAGEPVPVSETQGPSHGTEGTTRDGPTDTSTTPQNGAGGRTEAGTTPQGEAERRVDEPTSSGREYSDLPESSPIEGGERHISPEDSPLAQHGNGDVRIENLGQGINAEQDLPYGHHERVRQNLDVEGCTSCDLIKRRYRQLFEQGHIDLDEAEFGQLLNQFDQIKRRYTEQYGEELLTPPTPENHGELINGRTRQEIYSEYLSEVNRIEAQILQNIDPVRLLTVGDGTLEYARALRHKLDEIGLTGEAYEITGSGIESRAEMERLVSENVTEEGFQGPPQNGERLTVFHEIDARNLEADFEPNSFDTIIFNNPQVSQDGLTPTEATGNLIDNLLESAPNVLRPNGEVHIGVTTSREALGLPILQSHLSSGIIEINGRRYQVSRIDLRRNPGGYRYQAPYPARRTTGGSLRGSRGPKIYYIFKLLEE